MLLFRTFSHMKYAKAKTDDGDTGMSFSQKVKKEITQRPIHGACCTTAACYGIACFAKHFDKEGLLFHTERAYIAQWAKARFLDAGIAGRVYVRKTTPASYEFAVRDGYEPEKMLALFAHSGEETAVRIKRENILCSGCFCAFLAAAFVCGGVAPDPQKGYVLEFVSPRFLMMRDFETLLAEHGFEAKSAVRKGANVLYFKSSEQIEDLLTSMGAQNAALEIMNLKVYKDFRNKANRITNCETANIDKIVQANSQVISAIRLLQQENALGSLPEALQQAAQLRMENPMMSLAELAKASSVPVSKSGLSHRYKKICEKAEEITALKNTK